MRVFCCGLALALCSTSIAAAELKIKLPLSRKAYQTNERIDISAIRSSKEALTAGTLILSLEGADGSKLSFTFPVTKAAGGTAVEHLHVNDRLLRPGKYQVAQTASRTPAPAIAWSVNLPDKIVGITRNGAGVDVLTYADVLAKVADGKVKTRSLVSPDSYAATAAKMQTQSLPMGLAVARKQAPARRLVKYAVKQAKRTAVAYWGGTLAIMDERGAVLAERSFPQDITALCWLDSQLIVGDADGRVLALNLK